MYKHNLVQKRQVASMSVILHRTTQTCRGGVNRGKGACVLGIRKLNSSGSTWLGPAHGFKAMHRVSRINRGHKRPVKCCLLKCKSHKIIHSSLVSSGPAALGFVPGPPDEPLFYCLNRKIWFPQGKGLDLSLTFYQSCPFRNKLLVWLCINQSQGWIVFLCPLCP